MTFMTMYSTGNIVSVEFQKQAAHFFPPHLRPSAKICG